MSLRTPRPWLMLAVGVLAQSAASVVQSVPAFLVDGRVAGTWSYEKGKVKTKAFTRLDAKVRRELREEGERLAELHA